MSLFMIQNRMASSSSVASHAGLVRAIGRWSLVALVVNSIIGSGVFGLPSTVAGLIGRSSIWAVVAAGGGMAVIMGCFAEVASRFQQAGGPYLYARVAFGRFMGIQTAWMLWLGQVAAPAANAPGNLGGRREETCARASGCAPLLLPTDLILSLRSSPH